MSGFGDGIGTVIEGGLLGRAVEPKTGEGAEHASGHATCANCQTVFSGHYCPECGQKAHVHRSLTAIGHDILHGVLHLDGKLWDTLPLLAFKPGELTRRYIAGERAKFVSPMAMFLFTVFAMFAVFQMVGVTAPTDFAQGIFDGFNDDDKPPSVFETNIQQQITELEKERDGLSKGDSRRESIDAELAIIRKMIGQGEAADADALADADADADADDKNPVKVTVDPATEEWLGSGIIKKWKQNPSLMLYKLQSNGYKFSWLLIPLSLPFVWLLFAWRRQFKAYDHAIFVTYSLSFMSLLFIILSIMYVIPVAGDWIGVVFAIAVPLHLYKQLRYAYGLSRFSAMWRFFMLINFIPIVLTLFAQVLLVLGAF